MKHDYEWYFSVPKDSINVNMINYKNEKKVFDATLTLKEKSVSVLTICYFIH